MRGHVRRRGKDSWQVIVYLGKDENGKKLYRSQTVRGTRQDAERALAELLVKAHRGELGRAPRGLTVAGLLNAWVEAHRRSWRPNTLANKRTAARAWGRLIGHLEVERLTPADVELALARLAEEYAPSTAKEVFSSFRQALRWARKRKLLHHDPTEGVPAPRGETQEITPWTGEEAARFLEYLEKARMRKAYKAFFRLALATGMRLGELQALRWQDVDLKRGEVCVRRTYSEAGKCFHEPKTKKARRRIPIDPVTTAWLREWRKEQLEERLRAGEGWADREGLVFTTRKGTVVDRDDLLRALRRACREAGVPGIRFHDLRHTHASLLLRQNVHPKVVQERLGHASVKTTLDLYSHLLPGAQEPAVRAVAELLDRRIDSGLTTATEGPGGKRE
ncbi:integrase family protein [Ammonifex degensii KC4]|uniref:Integrase family protein n=1 Tax=Ammonifex degensii (strain DSM 10501 / KC4) TaxID=429009 RepID=C9R814_AMMDK|nr:site-specific integrase [Ammonifex degensii]ACX52443.1 integrase family protein [Ammonifex degensii KC4]